MPVLGSNSRFSTTKKTFWWGIMFLMALAIFLIDLQFLNPHHPYRPYHFKVRWALIPHLMAGSIAILSGPVQFSSRIRRKYPKFHRILGRCYVGGVLVAAPLGILITIIGPKDPFYTTGIATHSGVWFITTLMAFLTARNGQIPEHKQWMVRSYVVTFSFIATRALGPFWALVGVNNPHSYGMVDTGLNIVYLLAADIALNWRQITTKRHAQPVRARPASKAEMLAS